MTLLDDFAFGSLAGAFDGGEEVVVVVDPGRGFEFGRGNVGGGIANARTGRPGFMLAAAWQGACSGGAGWTFVLWGFDMADGAE